MPIFNNILAGASGQTSEAAAGYQIDRSLRFNSGDSAYLNRTPSSKGKRRTWTWSGWVKRSKLASKTRFFGNLDSSGYNGVHFEFTASDQIRLIDATSSVQWELITTPVYRDPSAWYHIVVSFDTTESTAADRVKLYVNGAQVTNFNTNNYPTSNYVGQLNTAQQHALGRSGAFNVEYFNGYFADVHFIDGQALAPTDFGEYNDNNVWQPKEFDGTFGPLVDQSQTWSTYGSASDGGFSLAAERGFNGDLFNQTEGNTTGAYFSIPFSTTIASGDVGFVSFASGGSGHMKLYNGSTEVDDVTSSGNSQFRYSTYAGAITEIRISRDSRAFEFAAVSVFGKILVDAGYSYTNNSFKLNFSDNTSTTTIAEDSSGNNNDWTANNFAVSDTSVASYASGYGGNMTTTEAAKFFDSDDTDYGVATGDFVGYSYSAGGKVRLKVENTSENAVSFYIQPRVSSTFVNQGKWSGQSAGTVNNNAWTVPGSTTATAIFAFPYNHDGNGRLYLVGNSANLRLYSMKGANDEIIDSLIDSPTNYEADSGNNGGNYCTFNPVDKHSSAVLSDGNLKVKANTTAWQLARSTFFLNTGKHYWEFTWTGTVTSSSGYQMGLKTPDSTLSAAAQQAGSYAFQFTSIYLTAGSLNTVSVSPGSTHTNDTVMFAYDADAGKMWLGVNGTWNGSGDPATGANPDWTSLPTTGLSPFAGCYGTTNAITLNAGQRPFAYTPPTGYKSLCTTNLDDPTIDDGSTAFEALAYTGDGGTSRSISSLNFSPDLVWFKNRGTVNYHQLHDVLRGTDGDKRLYSNDPAGENTYTTALTSFDDNGWTMSNGTPCNANNNSYVAWSWDAGSSTVSNTDGSTTSSVRANASAGFSIVTWTGTGANATIGHGLSDQPSLILVKNRDTSSDWRVYHNGGDLTTTSGGNFSPFYHYRLNTVAARNGSAIQAFTNTRATSSVFTYAASPNVNNDNFVAYCWAAVEGYSAFGHYIGNASSDGPFVFTGMRPRWVLLKGSDVGGTGYDWVLYDAARDTYNVGYKFLCPNTEKQELRRDGDTSDKTDRYIDILSNGFKIRNSNANYNQLDKTYIYAAFAEHTFKTSRAR